MILKCTLGLISVVKNKEVKLNSGEILKLVTQYVFKQKRELFLCLRKNYTSNC